MIVSALTTKIRQQKREADASLFICVLSALRAKTQSLCRFVLLSFTYCSSEHYVS